MIKNPGAMASKAGTGLAAVCKLYQAYLTGLILYLVQHEGAAATAELVFRVFRTQREEKFLPALKSLGLDDLPDAVAAAQYIYLGNHIGGVKVQYARESDVKAWVRYPPPRWIYEGPAICAVPPAVSRAFMRAFHAQCGASLGNLRLGFVCTAMTVSGDPGLEGYFLEYDHDLAPEERLRFATGEIGPDYDAQAFPTVDWPPERLAAARRNYAMTYIANLLAAMVDLFGAEATAKLGAEAGRLIGMQLYDETADLLGIADRGPAAFAAYMAALGVGQGDEIAWRRDGAGAIVRQNTWRLMRGTPAPPPAVFDAWNGLWQGALAAHDRRLGLTVQSRQDRGAPIWQWRIAPTEPG